MSKNTIITGDIFQLGEHRLACGDCRDTELIKKLLGKDRIELILTDPPYGVSYVEGKRGFTGRQHHEVIANDHEQSDEEYHAFTKDWLAAATPYMAKKNSIYIFNSDKMIFPLRAGMEAAGCKFAQMLIWLKTHAVMGRLDYLPQHEILLYGWYGTHAFRKSKDKSILIYPKPSKSVLHPTMKPVGLLRRLILNSSNIGELVYDPFGGSGSTLVAAQDTKRRCAMIEMDARYCRVIIDRFEKHTGVKAVPLSKSTHVR
jgi:DNA modification methylase